MKTELSIAKDLLDLKIPELEEFCLPEADWDLFKRCLAIDLHGEELSPRLILVDPGIRKTLRNPRREPRTLKQKIHKEFMRFAKGFEYSTKKLGGLKGRTNMACLEKAAFELDEHIAGKIDLWEERKLEGDPPLIVKHQKKRRELIATWLTWRVQIEATFLLDQLQEDKELKELKKSSPDYDDKVAKHFRHQLKAFEAFTKFVISPRDIREYIDNPTHR